MGSPLFHVLVWQAWTGIYEGTASRLQYSEQRKHIFVNMKSNDEFNRRILAKIKSPCLPSIQQSVCKQSKYTACGPTKPPLSNVMRHRFVFDPVRKECVGPILSDDWFATMRTMRECVDECQVRRIQGKEEDIAGPGIGHFAFLCIGDMAGELTVGAFVYDTAVDTFTPFINLEVQTHIIHAWSTLGLVLLIMHMCTSNFFSSCFWIQLPVQVPYMYNNQIT